MSCVTSGAEGTDTLISVLSLLLCSLQVGAIVLVLRVPTTWPNLHQHWPGDLYSALLNSWGLAPPISQIPGGMPWQPAPPLLLSWRLL